MDTFTITAVLLLACLSCFTTVLGVLLAIYVSRSVNWIAAGIGFSAGIMLLISLLELIPESLTVARPVSVLLAVVAGAVLIGTMHYLMPHTHLFKEDGIFGSQLVRTSYLVAFGLILHDFPEGFAMANAYITSPNMGVAVALAIALHNIPEEFAMAVPAAALNRKLFLIRAAIISGLAEPVGASVGLLAAHVDVTLVPLFMAFAAGAMIFVSLHELLPMAKQYGRLPLFAYGMFASVLAYLLLAMLFPK